MLASLLVLATALPLLRIDQWWIRVLDFPKAQIAIVGAVLLGAYLCGWNTPRVHDSVLLSLLVLAVVYPAVKIFPYTVLMSKRVLAAEPHSDAATLSLLVANVLMENRASDAFLRVAREYDPDVILTVETDAWWEEALTVLEAAYPVHTEEAARQHLRHARARPSADGRC